MSITTPVVKPGESLFSFLYRYAASNKLDSVESLGFSLTNEEHHSNFLPNDIDVQKAIDKLTSLSGLTTKEMSLNQFVEVLLNSSTSPTERHRHFYKSYVKYCPLCMSENYYHRLHWDFALVTTCEKHHVLLQERCSKCGGCISLLQFMQDRCGCDSRISRHNNNNPVVNQYVLDAQNTLLQLFLGLQESVTVSDGTAIERQVYFELVDAIGKLFDGFDDNAGIFKSAGISLDAIDYLKQKKLVDRIQVNTVVTSFAHDLIVNPTASNFEAILWSFHQMSVPVRLQSAKVKSLKKLFLLQGGDRYFELYFRFIESESHAINPSGVINAIPKQIRQRNLLSVSEAALLLRRGDRHIIKLIQNKTISSEVQTRYGKNVILIEPSSLQSWVEQCASYVERYKAREMLGVSPYIFDQLVEIGLIDYVHNPQIDNHPKYLLNEKDVVNLAANITRYSKVEQTSNDEDEWTTLSRAAKSIRQPRSIISIIQWLIAGEVRSVVWAKEDLRSLRVNKADVQDKVLRQYERRYLQ